MFAIPEVGYTLYNLSNHIVKLSNEVLFREKGEWGNVVKRRNAKKEKNAQAGDRTPDLRVISTTL